MDRVAEEEIRRAGHVRGLAGLVSATVARAERVGPRSKARTPAQGAGPFERIDRQQPGRVLHHIAVDEQQERREGRGLGEGRCARAPVESDRASAVGEVEGDERGARVSPEKQGGVLDGEHALGRDLPNDGAAGVEVGEGGVPGTMAHGSPATSGKTSLSPTGIPSLPWKVQPCYS